MVLSSSECFCVCCNTVHQFLFNLHLGWQILKCVAWQENSTECRSGQNAPKPNNERVSSQQPSLVPILVGFWPLSMRPELWGREQSIRIFLRTIFGSELSDVLLCVPENESQGCSDVLLFSFSFSPNLWLVILSVLPLFSSDFINCSSECLCACSAEYPLELFFWTAVLRMHKICLPAASPFSVPAPSSEQHRRLQCSVSVLPFLRFVQSHQKFSTCVPVLFHWFVKGSSIFSCESHAFLHLPPLNYVCFTPPFWGNLCWLYRSFHSAVQVHHCYLDHLCVLLIHSAEHLCFAVRHCLTWWLRFAVLVWWFELLSC